MKFSSNDDLRESDLLIGDQFDGGSNVVAETVRPPTVMVMSVRKGALSGTARSAAKGAASIIMVTLSLRAVLVSLIVIFTTPKMAS
jgi:hypothetical protein